MDCLAEKDWVGVGKQWADVPPRVKHTMAVILTIPDSIHQQLLLSKNLSIHQLVDDITIGCCSIHGQLIGIFLPQSV